jgi:hypothetical protein
MRKLHPKLRIRFRLGSSRSRECVRPFRARRSR